MEAISTVADSVRHADSMHGPACRQRVPFGTAHRDGWGAVAAPASSTTTTAPTSPPNQSHFGALSEHLPAASQALMLIVSTQSLAPGAQSVHVSPHLLPAHAS